MSAVQIHVENPYFRPMDLKKLTIKELEMRIDRTSDRIHTIVEIAKDIKNSEAKSALLDQNRQYKRPLQN